MSSPQDRLKMGAASCASIRGRLYTMRAPGTASWAERSERTVMAFPRSWGSVKVMVMVTGSAGVARGAEHAMAPLSDTNAEANSSSDTTFGATVAS